MAIISRLFWEAGKSVPSCAPATPTRLVTPPVSPGPTTMQEQMSWACQLELVDFSPTRMSSGWTLLGFSRDTTSAGLPTALVSDHEHWTWSLVMVYLLWVGSGGF